MSDAVEHVVPVKYSTYAEFKGNGVDFMVYREDVDEHLFCSHFSFDQLVEAELGFNVCAGKLLANGVAEMLDIKQQLLQAAHRISELVEEHTDPAFGDTDVE